MANKRRNPNDFLGELQDIGRQFGILANKGLATAYEAGAYRFLGNQFMTITTKGRKSGLPRTTPIGYVETSDYVYAITRGGATVSNWWRNVKQNPQVKLQIGEKVMTVQGEVFEDSNQVRRIIQLFLKQRPGYSRFLGVDASASEAELERVARNWLAARFQLKKDY